jgi:two-component sensor histidine kinase
MKQKLAAGKRILLVENDAGTAEMYQKILEGAGYRVKTADCCEAALAAVHEAAAPAGPSESGIDLVLLEIELGKGIDGAETARRILKRKELPLLFLSGHNDEERVARAADVPRFGYVLKQSGTAVLLSSIESALSLHSIIREKELRLKEIHHRVKNDLLFVSSLFQIQDSLAGDGTHRKVFEKAHNRLSVMMRVYDQLNDGHHGGMVSVKEMMEQLFKSIHCGKEGAAPIFDLHINDFLLPSRTGVALGIIANELVCNTMKYGFKKSGEPGRGSLSVRRPEEGTIELVVRDSGPGFPDPPAQRRDGGFGFTVIHALAGQYNGFVELKNDNGAVARVVLEG